MKGLIRAAALAVGLVAHPALAVPPATSGYTDETAWRNDNAGFVLETFESLSAGQTLSALAGLHIEFGAPLPVVRDKTAFGGLSQSGSNTLGNASPSSITLFAEAGRLITGLGYWNTGFDDRTTLKFFFDGSFESLDSPAVGAGTAGQNLSFVGLKVGQGGVQQVEIAWFTGVGNGDFTIDDLQVATTPIPEPGTWAMLLAGLAIFGLSGRSRGPGHAKS